MEKKHSIQNFIGSFVYLFAQWVMTVVVVRFTNNFFMAGILAIAMTISNVFYIFASYGMRTFQITDIHEKYKNTTYVLSRLVTVVLSLFFCFIYSLIQGYNFSTVSAILLYMLYKCIEAFSDVIYGIYQKNNNFFSVCVSLTAKGILTIGVFSIIIKGFSLNTALIAASLVSLAILVFYDLSIVKRYTEKIVVINKKAFSKAFALLKESSLMVVILLSQPILLAITRLYYEQNYSTELFGVYSSLSAPTMVILTFVTCVIIPFVPMLSKYYSNNEEKLFIKWIAIAFGFILGFGAIVYIGAVFFGEWALSLLYGDGIRGYGQIFNLIVICTIIMALLNILNLCLVSIRRLKGLALALLVGCVVGYIITPYFVNHFAMEGIVYSMVISLLVQIGICAVFLIAAFRKMTKPAA